MTELIVCADQKFRNSLMRMFKINGITDIVLLKNRRNASGKGIIIFGGKYSDIPPGFTAVAASDDKRALNIIKNHRVPAVICGMSSSDTISMSAFGENSASVSLQRSIFTPNGQKIEAKELNVSFKRKPNPYIILILSAAMLLSGDNSDRFAI